MWSSYTVNDRDPPSHYNYDSKQDPPALSRDWKIFPAKDTKKIVKLEVAAKEYLERVYQKSRMWYCLHCEAERMTKGKMFAHVKEQ